MATPVGTRGAFRIRLGIGLVLVSWLPIAQAVIWLADPSQSTATEIRAAIWGIQILIGLAGVAVAGKETIDLARSVGWRRLPGAVWALLRSPATGNG